MIIRWLDDAVLDLQSLRNYIARDDVNAARRTAKKIIKAIDILREQPACGRCGRISHTRELIIAGTPYIVAYRIKHNAVELLRILHGAMQWPDTL